jgi:hypothetical protein
MNERLDLAQRAFLAAVSDVLEWLDLLKDSERATSLDAVTAALVDAVKLGVVVETALVPALRAARDHVLSETASLKATLDARQEPA